jgi:serine/threonine protein kinase
MHEKMGLTHTDLKPENILLKLDTKKQVTNRENWPIQVKRKKDIYDGEKCDESESEEPIDRYSYPDDGCTGGEMPTIEELRMRQRRFKERVWLKPLDEAIKIIDFGGATYDDEKHNSIINTRQYRAPEVILNCCDWDKKSDIWSMVCILIEMYTGELFYETREDIEHLAMIEKQCGPIPDWMANGSTQRIFLREGETKMVENYKMHIDWPQVKRKQNSFE